MLVVCGIFVHRTALNTGFGWIGKMMRRGYLIMGCLSKCIAFEGIDSMRTVAYIYLNIMSPDFGLNITLDLGVLRRCFLY